MAALRTASPHWTLQSWVRAQPSHACFRVMEPATANSVSDREGVGEKGEGRGRSGDKEVWGGRNEH